MSNTTQIRENPNLEGSSRVLKDRLPLRWHRQNGQRAWFPVLTAAQVHYLFDQAEKDRAAHPRKKKTILHYRGRRFMVDATPFSLRLWFRKTLVARRFGMGL